MNNKFLNKLKRLDPKNVEYKVDKNFEAETGIHGKRFQAIVKSGGKDASVEEANRLIAYFSKTSGKNLSFYDIFTTDGSEEELFPPEDIPEPEKPKSLFSFLGNMTPNPNRIKPKPKPKKGDDGLENALRGFE